MVRALASHQCGPGSIPGLGFICGLSLLLVLVPAPRVFLRVLRFSSLRKNQHFQIPIRPGNSGEKSHPVDSTEIPIYFIYFIFILFFNTPLVKFIRRYIRDPSGVFSMSSIVKILMTSFSALFTVVCTNGQ